MRKENTNTKTMRKTNTFRETFKEPRKLVAQWRGVRRAWGGPVATKGWEEDERLCRGREGDHSSPRSFSERVAALRIGLQLLGIIEKLR